MTLNQSCPKCGAQFLEGQLYWSTGKPGNLRDLAGLVCNNWGDASCINPDKGSEGGDTWAKRREFMSAMDSELDLPPID